MAFIQLPLPFAVTSKLNEEQKLSLITNQSKRLEISDIEIASLIEICQRKGFTNKGLAIIYKYTNYIEEILSCLSKLTLLTETFLKFDSSVYLDSVVDTLSMIVHVILNLLISLINWRKLQGIPRPISVEEGNTIYSLSEFILHRINVICHHLKIWHGLPELDCSELYLQVTLSLFQAAKSFTSDSLLSLYHSKRRQQTLTKIIETLLQSINKLSQLPDSKDFSQLLLNVLFIEDLINHKWTTNSQSATSSSGEGSTKNSPNITLFIPYHGFKQYIPQMKWFFHLFSLYDKYLEILNSNIDCFKNHPSTFVENLQSKGKVIILSVCPILIKSITSLDMIHMHYSPYGSNNLQLQTPSTMPILPSPLEPISEHRDSGITQIVEFNQIRRPVNFRSRSYGQPEEKIIRPQSFDTLESESSAPYEPLYDFNDVVKTDPKINDTLLKPISPIEIESKELEHPPMSTIQRETPVPKHRDSEDIQITYIDSPEVDISNFSSPDIKEQHYYMNLRSRVKSADEISTDFQNSPILPYRPRMLSDPITTTTKKKLYSKKKNFRNPLISYRAVDVSSTSLFLALSLIDVTNKSVEEIAVRKIEIWYMIMAPRRKLSKRLMMRNCIMDAIDFIIDRTMQLAINRRRRRKYLMRQGAAMKIQRFYRVWVHSVLQEEKRLENEEKSKFVNFHLNLWYRAIMASIRIYRFLRNCMKNKIIRRSIYFQDIIREEEAQKALSPLYHPVLMIPQFIPSNKMRRQRTSFQTLKLKTILQNYMILLSFYRKIELQQQIITRFDSKLQTTGTPTQLFKKTHNRRLQMFKQMENAVILIQSIYRTFLTRRLFKERLKYNRMSMKIAMFMIRYISWRRSTRKRKLNKCAVTIQKFFRGLHIRYRIFRLVQAGLKLNTFWRKHLAHSRLRSQLRRVDKPYTVVVHGIRNLPKKFVNSESVRFQLSVWWNPLLHIVGRNDFNVILHSKQPQYIYLSDYHKVVEQIIEDDEDNTEPSENKGTIASLLPLASRARLSIFGGRARSPSKYLSSTMSSSTVNKSAIPSSPVPSPSKLQLPEISSSSKNKPTENIVNSDQETESFRKSAVEKGQNALKSRLMAIRMNNSLKNSSSGKIEESGDSLKSNSQKSDPIPPPPRSTTPPRISNDRLRRLREIAIQNEKDDSDDSFNENSDDERRDSFDVNHELPQRNSSKKLLPNASDRQLSKNAMDNDQSSDSDKESQAAINERNSPTDKKTPNVNVIRKGLNFAMKLGSIVQNKKGSAPKPQPNLVCIFEDETIKIPGCHGNSVFKFEILDGDRKVAHCFFYLGREGDLMFWGGEYHREITTNQNRRQHQFANISNSKALNKNVPGQTIVDSPVLDFRIIAGAPLRSRCQWARLFVKGNGPLKRAIQGHNMFGSFGSFSLFGNWHRYYLSLDEFGLSLFNNKFNSQPFFTIPVKELKRVHMDMGAPIGVLNNTSKNVVEDIINVILTTTSGDELFIRFPDSGSRISWIEVLTNTIKYSHGSHISNVQNKNWLSSTILGTKKSSSPSKSSKYAQPNLTKVTEEEQEAKHSDDSESDDDDDDKETNAFQANRSPHSPYKPGSMLVLRSNSQNFLNNKIQTLANIPNSPHHNSGTVQGIRSRIQPLLSTFSPSIGKRKTMVPANKSS